MAVTRRFSPKRIFDMRTKIKSMDMEKMAHAYTRKLTYGHYENFPVASWLIPKNLRQHVCNIYAFARTADDFADEARFEGQRMERLEEWRRLLLACVQEGMRDDRSPQAHSDEGRGTMDEYRLIFAALGETIRDRAVPVALCNDLITAFMIDVKKTRYRNFGEVMHYCRHSANPVGRLILYLFGYGNESWMVLADKICTALQLANFWQDVAVDLQKDRIYLPQDELAQFGVTEAHLLTHDCTDGVRALIKFQVERTRALFAAGRALCDTVPHPRLRFELKLTWLGGMRILEGIEANRYNPFVRPLLTKRDWARLVWRSWRWAPVPRAAA